MAKFTKGQPVAETLRKFKEQLLQQFDAIQKETDPSKKIELLNTFFKEYDVSMRSLSTIYKGGSERIDAIKEEIKNLYQQVKKFSETNADVKNAFNSAYRVTKAPNASATESTIAPTYNPVPESLVVTPTEPEVEAPAPEDPDLVAIDEILKELKSKIGEIDKHKNSEAYNAATRLLQHLRLSRTLVNLGISNKQYDKTFIIKAFKQSCTGAINQAKDVLSRDLGWGGYLTNLLKALLNTVVKAVTFGKTPTFFTPIKPASLQAVEKFEEDLAQIPRPVTA